MVNNIENLCIIFLEMTKAEITILQKIKSSLVPIVFNIVLPMWDVVSDARIIILLLFIGGYRCKDYAGDSCKDDPTSYCTADYWSSFCEEVTHPLFGLMMLVPFIINYLVSIYTWIRRDNNKKFTFMFPLLNLYAPYGKRLLNMKE